MSSETSGETPCIEHLRREAFDRLRSFPNKIIELNDFVNEYMPDSVRKSEYDDGPAGRKPKCQSTLSTARNCELNSVSDCGVSSHYSLPMRDRGRSRHGVCRRRYYRSRGITGCNIRRRPGPLGQLLAFIVGSLATCTKRMLVAPTRYIMDSAISMLLLHRRRVKNVQSGPVAKWTGSSPSACVTPLKNDNTVIGKLIDIMRPAVVQLISDTTTLKHWLQAVTLTTAAAPTELTNATRNTETVDGWAYDLFFHLKYLQVNRARRTTDNAIVEAETKGGDDAIHSNLWHRLAQLRDNYIILYETLQSYEKIADLDTEKCQE